MKNNFQFLRIALFSAFIIIGFSNTSAQFFGNSNKVQSKTLRKQLKAVANEDYSNPVLKSVSSDVGFGLKQYYCPTDAIVNLVPPTPDDGVFLNTDYVDPVAKTFDPSLVSPSNYGRITPVTYIDGGGNSTVAELVVYANSADFELSIDDSDFCDGSEGNLTLESSEIGLYQYGIRRNGSDYGEVQYGTGGPLSWKITEEGTYTAWSKHFSTGCEIELSSSVDVKVNPLPPVVVTNDGPICDGEPLTLSASPVGAEYTYAWTGPNGFTSTEQSPVVNPTSAASDGTYTVEVTNTTTTCQSSASTTAVIRSIPVPTITGNQTVCLNSSVTYTTESGMSNYVWTYPAEFVPTSATNTNTITGTWTTLGVGKLQVVYENLDACTSPVLGELDITTTEATAGLTSDKGTSICVNTLVVFTATGGVSYEFMVNGMTVQGPATQSTFSINTLNDGDVVTVKVIDTNGCEDTHPGITMTVLPEPTINLIADDLTPCENTPITLTASGATTYTFYKNGSIVQGSSTQATYTTVASLNSGDEFYVVGNDGSCDGTSNTLTINVNPLPVIGLVSDKGNVFCTNENVTFTASNAITYEFFVDDVSQGAASTTATFTSSLLTDGQVVKVIGTDGNGCEGETSITVTVNEIVASLNITNPNPPGASVCIGTEVTFNASASGGSGNYTYEFFVDGSSQGVSTNSIFQHIVIADVKIEVNVVDINLNCEDITEANLVALSLPNISITSPANNDQLCINDPVTIISSPSGYNNYTFYYDNGSGAVVLYDGTSETYTKADGFIEGGQLAVVADNGSCTSQSAIVNFSINPLPTINLSSDKAGDEFCKGETVTFTASGGTSYEFQVDGSTVQGPSAQNTYMTSALTNGQEVKVIGTDVNACSNEDIISVTVNEASAGLSSDLGTTICENTPVTFTATGGISYEFFVNGINFQGPSVQATFVKSDLVDGDVVTVKVIDGNGCEDTHSGITMTVKPEPLVNLNTSAAAICFGEEVTFTASGADAYEFYYNNVLVQGPSVTATYVTSSLNNSDEVYAKGITATCEGLSNVISTTVNPLPAVNLVSDQPSDEFCKGETVTFSANGAVTYEFFVDGLLEQGPSSQSTFVKNDLTGGQVVSVVGFDAIGCESTRSITVTVNEAVAGLTSDIGPTICENELVTFTATGGTSYEFFIDGLTVQGPSPLSTYVSNSLNNNEVITVKVIDGNGCEDTHAGIVMSVSPAPVVVLSPDPAEICQGESINFSASGATQYEFFVNGFSIQGPSNQDTFVLSGASDGDDVYVVGSDGTCVGTSNSVSVIVNPLPTASLSSSPSGAIVSGTEVVFTAGGGDVYEFFVNGSSVQAGANNIYIISTLIDGDIVSVEVTDNSGCKDTEEITVQVLDGILLKDVIATSENYCEGESGVGVYVSSPQIGISYELIKISDGSVAGSAIEYDGINQIQWDNILGTEEYLVKGFYAALPSDFVEMNNRVTITENILPIIFELSPTGKVTGCNSGAGHDIILSGSEMNHEYILLLNGTEVSRESGTNGELKFENNTIIGIYEIQSVSIFTGCSVMMNGQLEIESDGSDIAYDLFVESPADPTNPLDGRFCASSDPGVEIRLSNSGDASLEYELYRVGDILPVVTVSGSNSEISFGIINIAGDYSARVKSSAGCELPMNNTVTVTPVDDPQQFTLVTDHISDPSSGDYCYNSTGLHIGLDGTEAGIVYDLYLNGTTLIDSKIGVLGGNVIFEGPIAIDGVYSVTARVEDLGCPLNMLNTIELQEISKPIDVAVRVDNLYFCTSEITQIIIDNPESNIEYRYYNSDRSIEGAWVSSSSAITFDISIAGTYDVEARKLESGYTCGEVTIAGGPYIIVEELLPSVVTISTNAAADPCDGDIITVESSVSDIKYRVVYEDGPGNYTELPGYEIVGDGSNVDFAPISDAGKDYYVIAVNDKDCKSGISNGVNISNPGAIKKQELVGNGNVCLGSDLILSLTDSELGVDYTLYIQDASDPTNLTLIEGPLAGGGVLNFTSLSIFGEGDYLVIGDNGTCINEMQNRISVQNVPLPIAGLSSDLGNSICVTDIVTFTATGGELYEFFVNGASVQGPSLQDTYTTNSLVDGDVVSVQVSDSNGCDDLHSGIVMTVNSLPTVTLSAALPVCAGDVVTFEATGATSYEFFVNDISVQGPSSATTYVTDALVDGDKIYVIGSNGLCSGLSNSIISVVNPLPNATLVANPSGTIISGTKVTFTASGGVEYVFYIDGAVEQARSTNNIFETSTLIDGQEVTVEVFDSNGCIDTESLIISVLDVIVPKDVLSSSDFYCEGTSGVTVYVTSPQLGVSYELIKTSDNSSAGIAIEYDGINLVSWDNIFGDEEYKVEGFYISDPTVKTDMNNTVTITEVAIPLIYDLSPTGTVNDCNAPTGYDINLSGSELGVTYFLTVNGDIVTSLPGDGNPLVFGGNLYAGLYEITALSDNASCTVQMNGSYEVSISGELFDLFVEGAADPTDGRYCTGNSGVELKLSDSELAVSYELYKDGIGTGNVVIGTGDGVQLSFGNIEDEGSYLVRATTADGCILLMNNVIEVVEVDVPDSYNLYSDNPVNIELGEYCYGSDGVMLYLNNQQEDIEYSLYVNGTFAETKQGTSLVGTPLYFDGPINTDGTYTVLANVKDLVCTTLMNNSIEVAEVPQPQQRTIKVDIPYFCTGEITHIIVESPEIGVSYRVISEEGFIGSWETSSTGFDLSLTVEEEGIYWVEATNGELVYNCTIIRMTDGPHTIVEELLPNKIGIDLTINSDPCIGDVITVLSSENGIRYRVVYESEPGSGLYLELPGYEIVGDGSDVNFAPISDSGRIYYVIAVSDKECKSDLSNGVEIKNDYAVEKYVMVGDGDLCSGELIENFGLTLSEIGVDYTLWFSSAYDGSIYEVEDAGIIEGTGIDIEFNNFFARGDGEYYVTGSNGTCENEMLNRISSVVNDLPVAYPMTGSGITCDLFTEGATIGLVEAELNTEYYLFYQMDSSSSKVFVENLDITKDPIETIVNTEGLYSVIARNSFGCTSNMNGSVNVKQYSEVPLDTVLYDKNGYCENDEDLGLPISLTNGRDSIYYQVIDINDPTIVYLPTEGSADLGGYPAGTYNVFAYREGGACEVQLSHVTDDGDHEYDIIVVENPRPELNYELFIEGTEGSKQGFINSKIGMDNSQSSVTYQLSFEMNDVVGEMNGVTGESIVFDKPVDTSGKYYVFAETDKGCSGWINDFVSIYDSPLITYDDQLNFKKGYNQDTVNVAINDIFVLPLDSCIRDTAIGVHPDSLNINFFLLDIDENGDTIEVESIKRNRVGDYKINSTTGEIILVKTPEFFGRDTVKYVAKNINKNYSYRLDTASVYIYIGNKYFDDKQSFLLPNAFSPNGDGINDLFKITGLDLYYGSGAIKSTLEVFNRWGSMVYRSKEDYYGDGDNWWDGKSTESNMVSLGQDCPNGTYFYIFTVSVNLGDGDIIEDKFNGYIELRR